MADIVKVDLPALRAAMATIRDQRELIEASARDILGEDKPNTYRAEQDEEEGCLTALNAVGVVMSALQHIVEDEFRSPETKGGS